MRIQGQHQGTNKGKILKGNSLLDAFLSTREKTTYFPQLGKIAPTIIRGLKRVWKAHHPEIKAHNSISRTGRNKATRTGYQQSTKALLNIAPSNAKKKVCGHTTSH